MFDGPEYASYRDLMCDLRPPREFEQGDWYWSPAPREYVSCCHGFNVDREWSAGCVWLPRFDQWLAKLNLSRTQRVAIRRLAGGWEALLEVALDEGGWADSAPLLVGVGEIPEEAIARLFLAVTRKP